MGGPLTTISLDLYIPSYIHWQPWFFIGFAGGLFPYPYNLQNSKPSEVVGPGTVDQHSLGRFGVFATTRHKDDGWRMGDAILIGDW